MASLRAVEQFFMQVRHRYSLLERTLSPPHRPENIYSPYNPVVIQRLLNICCQNDEARTRCSCSGLGINILTERLHLSPGLT
jgi:hypothetical protein